MSQLYENKIIFLISVLLFVSLFACNKQLSPEDQVRNFITESKSAAESRSVIAFNKLISENYGDEPRQDRKALIGRVAGYFLRHKNIYLFSQIKEIHFPEQNTATVQLYVAMVGTPVAAAIALIDLHADLYLFDLLLVTENDEWRLKKAHWIKARIEDLFNNE